MKDESREILQQLKLAAASRRQLPLRQPVSRFAERTCGECSACCHAFSVEEVNKSIQQWCQHSTRTGGCNVYATRPSVCREYVCSWLAEGEAPESLRPDKTGWIVDKGDPPARFVPIHCIRFWHWNAAISGQHEPRPIPTGVVGRVVNNALNNGMIATVQGEGYDHSVGVNYLIPMEVPLHPLYLTFFPQFLGWLQTMRPAIQAALLSRREVQERLAHPDSGPALPSPQEMLEGLQKNPELLAHAKEIFEQLGPEALGEHSVFQELFTLLKGKTEQSA